MEIKKEDENEFTPYYEITGAVGGRIGICSCKICGAAILLEAKETGSDFDAIKRHSEWHHAG